MEMMSVLIHYGTGLHPVWASVLGTCLASPSLPLSLVFIDYSSFDFLQFPDEEEETMRTHRKI